MRLNILLGIGIILFLGVSGLVNAQGIYYEVEMYYDKGNIEVRNINIGISQTVIEELEKYDYPYNESGILKIVDFNNEEVQSINFMVPNFDLYDTINESEDYVDGGVITLENVTFIVNVPYYENAQFFLVYDKNGILIDREDVSGYSKNYKKSLGKVEEEMKKGKLKKIFRLTDYNLIIVLSVVLVILVLILVSLLINRRTKKK